MKATYNTLRSSDEANNKRVELSETTRKARTHELMRRIGRMPCILLVSGAVGIIAFIGYISFLWFAADNNPTWKNIALAGWITRSIAIAAVVLRTAITVQSGIVCSMIASIVLEGPRVALPELVTVSMMRAAPPAPYTLFGHIYTGTRFASWLATSFAAVLTVTTVLLQFTSTILLSDVSTGLVTAHPTSYPITIPRVISSFGDFKWTVGVRQYPAFAEYADGKVKNGSTGVSDTGLTIRGFLPIDGQGNRSSIHVFDGPATVVDSRVVCVRPNITNLGTRLAPYLYNRGFPTPILTGNISIPLELLQEVSASRLSPLLEPSEEFNCSISYGIAPDHEDAKYHPSDWDLSICQLDQRGHYLRDAWMTLDEPLVENLSDGSTAFPIPGPAYLLVNFSSRVKFKYTAYPKVDYSMIQDIFNESTPELVRRNRGDWIDVYRTNNNFTAADATLSFSLCYTASAAKYLNVSASSTVPLVQPRYSYDSVSKRIRFDDVRKQMLSSSHSTIEQRGILSLQSQLFEEDYKKPPYLEIHDTELAFKVPTFEGASTINLLQYYTPVTGRADISIGGLLLEILREGGTTAEAVQSMWTALLASRYQDYVFLNGGNMTYSTRSDFVAVQVPGGQGRPVFLAAGPTRSYILVMAAIFVHSLVMIFVIVWFCKATNATLLWESWSNISQVISPQTAPYLERAAQATDSEVKAWMKDDGLDDLPTGILTHSRTGETTRVSVRKRARTVAAEQNEAEQGLMMDELGPMQSSTLGTENSAAISRASSTSSGVAQVTGRWRSNLEA
ncbi:hypothetical protein FB567DRAFT_56031 [Paraphoma chrysanthemicola]|uniref:Uncharacterized protein n=1 Tax=Paraphoma chrysanthemicola TaxID=798071 RepID=A0A8K0R5G2_9PLEO|nr:hypothetical protein FB567DRAFT_56031 [Paraphoma chrysanthemicola]